jgi:hypothetical protein
MRLREQDVEKVYSLAFVFDAPVPLGKGAAGARRLQIEVGAGTPPSRLGKTPRGRGVSRIRLESGRPRPAWEKAPRGRGVSKRLT